MGLLDIGQALAALDNFKRRVGLLMTDPGNAAQQNTQGLLGNVSNMAQGQINAAHDMSSVVPEIAQQGQQQLTQGLLGLGPLQTVYHGSPHLFDKFDASKIGTGEGAQVYGHGLYFAENPAVAKSYQDALSDWQVKVGGKPVDVQPGTTADRALAYLQEAWGRADVDPFQWARKNILSQRADVIANKGDPKSIDAMVRQIDDWKSSGATLAKPGATYKADIPDEQVANMLDWDKPLSEQPKAVRDALPEVVAQEAAYKARYPSGGLGESLGANIYSRLADKLGGQDKAAAFLRDAGIPGIRYLDQGSRDWRVLSPAESTSGKWVVGKWPGGGAEQRYFDNESAARDHFKQNNTSNYVVFPGGEGLLKILSRE